MPIASFTKRHWFASRAICPAAKPPGFIAAGSFRIEPVPWLGDLPGYEDWYLMEGSWAMDPLNASAITGAMQAPHDDVAALMEEGHGGLYAHAGGEPLMAGQSTVSLAHAPARDSMAGCA